MNLLAHILGAATINVTISIALVIGVVQAKSLRRHVLHKLLAFLAHLANLREVMAIIF